MKKTITTATAVALLMGAIFSPAVWAEEAKETKPTETTKPSEAKTGKDKVPNTGAHHA